jgi:hypothetical protein
MVPPTLAHASAEEKTITANNILTPAQINFLMILLITLSSLSGAVHAS